MNFELDAAQQTKEHFMIEFVKMVLEKPNGERTNSEIGEVKAFLKTIDFFREREIKDDELEELVGVIKIETGTPGQEIIKYGGKGDKFYIVLKGSVEVLVPNTKIIGWRLQHQEYLQNV